MRQLALKTALSTKAADDQLVIVESLDLKTAKTKDLAAKLTKLNLTSATFLVDSLPESFDRASRNLPHIKVVPTEGANVYDILRQDKLVLTPNAVAMLQARFAGEAAQSEAAAKPAAKAAPAKAKPAAKSAKKEG